MVDVDDSGGELAFEVDNDLVSQCMWR